MMPGSMGDRARAAFDIYSLDARRELNLAKALTGRLDAFIGGPSIVRDPGRRPKALSLLSFRPLFAYRAPLF